ncbi:hypothetical protein [Isoptericola croceus]|uniref:hypothetical protein n=1 Tax=Isoptericola croceus TaxID=3031406 RepID=UPI0023F6807A|nr:hypothetical protein [Isoptericola croceus]
MKPSPSAHARLRTVALIAALSLGIAPTVAVPAVAAAPAAAAAASAATSVTTSAVSTHGMVTAPVSTLRSAKPTITGAGRVGNRLTAKPGKWATGTTFSYTWRVGGKKVASGKTFTPKKKHLGKKVTVVVKGKKSGTTVTRQSAAKKVSKGVFTAPKPKITGTAKVGGTLTAKPGGWKPKPAKLRYQWMANGKAIKGATSKKYKIKAAQQGKRITVRVKGTRSGYKNRTRVSAATAKVVRKPRITTQPTSVAVDAGKTAKMTVSATGGGLKYQWQRRPLEGGTWKNLSGKTSRTLSFKAKAKDTLSEYRVVVKNAAGTVRSKPALLFVDSTQAHPYPADTIYLGNYWMQVVGETALWRNGAQSEVYAYLVACPVSDGVTNGPYWDLYTSYKGGSNNRWYPGTEWDDGVDEDGCGIIDISATLPEAQAKGGIWSVTDHSGSGEYAPMTQYIAGYK